MKDLLIGAADLYDWSKIKVWATSARKSGFTGDIVLLTYRVSGDVVPNAEKLGIDVYQIDYDAFGGAITHNANGRDTQAHQMRFFHMWQYLASDDRYKEYRHIISTDVRDVWFQNNPSIWLTDLDKAQQKITGSDSLPIPLVASSEGLLYKDEPWGADNMQNGFGPIVWNVAQHWQIFNVGVLAGPSQRMMGLFLTLYNMTVGRYIPSDQSAYNILVKETMESMFYKTTHEDSWACQCGTMLDPSKKELWSNALNKLPHVKTDIYGDPSNGGQSTSAEPIISVCGDNRRSKFAIVHQWDRVPQLKLYVESLYA